MMKIAIMQPYIFPYIGYFQLLNTVDKFVIYDDVNFINKGWINRNRILMNQKDYTFTIPLKDASQNKLINTIELNWDLAWKGKFLKSIEQSYKKAPFYEMVIPIIQKSLNFENDNLSLLIFENLKLICDYLNIKTPIVSSSTIYKNTHLKAQDRILDICLQEKVTTYINPIGGMELYEKAIFQKQNIDLFFIKSKSITYPQFKNEFVPWLSIIDILMFNSVEKINEFLQEYELL